MPVKDGDLVYLTKAFDVYMHRKHSAITTRFENCLAKVEEILDWGSDKGQKIKAARLKTGKWANLPMEDCKYILSIYHMDLIGRGGQHGLIERGVPVFSKHPETREPFFEKVPDWFYKEVMKKCISLDIHWE
jgi:hypothetical protein